MKRNKWFMGGLLGAGILAMTAHLMTVRAVSTETSLEHLKPVNVIVVGERRFSASQEYGGFIRGMDQAVLTTKISGRITKIIKKEGEFVKKGEVIATLSADEITAQSQGAQQSITALEKTLENTKKYYNQKIDEIKDKNATKEEVQSAKRLRDLQVQTVKTEIVAAQGSLAVAQGYAEETSLRAPFTGVITRVFQEVGQVVGPTASICEIASQEKLSVEVFVSQVVMAQISKGESVDAFCGDDRKACQGTIESISPASEMNAQKSLVRILFAEKSSLISLGQYVSVRFPVSDAVQNRIVIPEESIIARYDEKFVFIAEGDIANERKVALGQIQDGMVEILSGVNIGEHLITKGTGDIRNNDKIKIYE